MTQIRAAIYLRISVEKADAIARQRTACQHLCEARGWKPVKEYIDDGVSASKSRESAAFGSLLADARAGQFDVVVAYAADRLARRLSDVEQLIETGVKAATVQGGLDLTTPEGEAQASILGTFARMEARQKSKRQQDANAQRAARGEPPSGRRLFGWREGEGEAVRKAVDDVMHGASLRAVCRDLNAAGHRTSADGPWQPFSLRDLLLNPRIAGLRVYKGTTYSGNWDPLIPEETWRALVDLLNNAERRTTESVVRKWLLSGFATCGQCGAVIRSGGRSHRGQKTYVQRRTYRCAATNHMVRAAEPVEAYVVEHALRRLARPDALALLEDNSRPDARQLRIAASTKRQRIDSLADLVADGTLPPASARAASERLRVDLAALESQLTDAGRAHVLEPLLKAADLRAEWESYGVDRQRTVLASLMDVAIHPVGRGARGFDPETVSIAWKGAD